MMNVSGSTAIIAGGGRGLGESIAREFAKQGASIWILDTNLVSDPINQYESVEIGGFAAAQSVCEELSRAGVEASAINCDTTNDDSVKAAFAQIPTPPKFVVNAVGVTQAVKVLDSSLAEFQAITRTNMDSVFNVSCTAAQKLIDLGESGSILNYGSIAGKTPFTDVAAYAASKAAVSAFSTSFAVELAEENTGIQVNTLCPGMIKTNMWDYLVKAMKPINEPESIFWERMESMIPQGRFQTAQAVSLFAIEIMRNSFITGQSLSIDGGMNRHA